MLADDPATVGQWSARTVWPQKAVHCALLPTGKVIWWPAFEFGDNPYLWDPATNTNTALPHVGANIFCAGLALFPDGRLLVAGGHNSPWTGLPNAYTFSPSTSTWTRLPDMNAGRWYPTNTTLPTGDVLVTSGWINTQIGTNVEPQVWQTATNSWRSLSSAHLALPFYPFMFVAPNGNVFCAGPSQTSRCLNASGTGSCRLTRYLEMIGAIEQRFQIKLDLAALDAEQITVLGPLSRYVAERGRPRNGADATAAAT